MQREKTAQAIASYFPEGTRLNVPDGGLSLWVELPHKQDVEHGLRRLGQIVTELLEGKA